MRTVKRVILMFPLLACTVGNVFTQDRTTAAGSSLTTEQKSALAAIDVRLAAAETLAAKIDDPTYKADVARQLNELRERRLALEKNFDQGLYEALMHSVISRYQVIALWLQPPPLPTQKSSR
jgi:hypothetical protein